MNGIIIFSAALVAISLFIAVLVAKFWKWQHPIFAAGVIVWLIFLVVNLTSEYFSPDYKLVSGMWVPFQLTIGSAAAFLGMLGAVVAKKISAGSN